MRQLSTHHKTILNNGTLFPKKKKDLKYLYLGNLFYIPFESKSNDEVLQR